MGRFWFMVLVGVSINNVSRHKTTLSTSPKDAYTSLDRTRNCGPRQSCSCIGLLHCQGEHTIRGNYDSVLSRASIVFFYPFDHPGLACLELRGFTSYVTLNFFQGFALGSDGDFSESQGVEEFLNLSRWSECRDIRVIDQAWGQYGWILAKISFFACF